MPGQYRKNFPAHLKVFILYVLERRKILYLLNPETIFTFIDQYAFL